ncbi:hypothetical protein [Pigmentiphaga litoralis]|uniref:hypothetical protein n=1 Tax=Pigmentiphaga litoralis TaxID=516702 RepID=UPI00389AF07C
MCQATITVTWLHTLKGQTVLEKVDNLPLRSAICKAREAGASANFLAGQLLAADGFVLANSASKVHRLQSTVGK